MLITGKPLYQCFNGEAIFFEWEKKPKMPVGQTLTWQLKRGDCLFIAFVCSLFSTVNLADKYLLKSSKGRKMY